MLNIARNPSQNAAALNTLASGFAQFQPTLASNNPPTAWTVAITYAPASLSGPTGIAGDQQGNVWIANNTSKSVTLLAPTGAQTGTYATGVTGTGAIAVDPSGNAWTPGTSASLIEVPAGGGTYKSFTGGGLGTTNALAIDALGQIWATGTQNGVSLFSNSGTPVSSTDYTGASAANAQSVAITSH